MKKQKQLPAPPAQNVTDEQMKKQSQSLPVVEQTEQKPLKKYTPEETRLKILEVFFSEGDLNRVLKDVGENILPKLLHGGKKEQKEVRKTMSEKVTAAMMALEVDSYWALKGSFQAQYWGMAKELSSQIVKEYNCTTHAEKMLAEIVVNGFIRTIDNSKRLNGCMDAGEYITPNRTQYLAMLSKQIDRSHRQYLSALMTLKQLKAPTIEMNIKTNNAFVSQNQQFNVPQAPNKTNEPK